MKSNLGIKRYSFDQYENNLGLMIVPFRYSKVESSSLKLGLQFQYETINIDAERGHHYHTDSQAHEEFCLISGQAALVVQDIDRNFLEVYILEKFITYKVPGLIPHTVINLSKYGKPKERAEILISKNFNWSENNLTEKFQVTYSDSDIENALMICS